MIEVTEKEIKKVINAIIRKAQKTSSPKVYFDNDAILKLVADKEWETNKNEALKDRAINRIRYYMMSELAENNIEVDFQGNKYLFTINDIKFNKPKKETKKMPNQMKTFTLFETEYIPPRQYVDIKIAIENGEKPLIVGPKGTGKSRAFEEIAAELNLKHIRIALGQVAEPADLIGTKEIQEINGVPVTVFVPGLITEAAQNGMMVILDEIDSVQPQVGLALNAVLESTDKIVCPTERGTQVVDIHPDFRIGATANSWGYGDETGFYSGVSIQNRATWDRLRPKFEFNYDPELEQLLLKNLLEEVKHCNHVIELLYDDEKGIVNKIRKSIETEDIHDECSMRSIIAFAKHYKIYNYHKAMYFLVNEFKPEYRETIVQMITTAWGQCAAPSMNDFDSDKSLHIPQLKNELENVFKEIEKDKRS